MKTQATYDVKLPSYAVCYLINDDDSGITEQDKKLIDDYMQQFYDKADTYNGSVVIDIGDDEPSFYWKPDFGLACDCYDATITILSD